MFQTVEAIVDEHGIVRLLEPIYLAKSRRALVTILEEEADLLVSETALLSEAAVANDWNRPEEDEAWSYRESVEEPISQSEADEAMNQEGAAYRHLHPALKEKYLGQYVAIYGGNLVDYDSDQVELYLRSKKRYAGEFVWIAPVQEEAEEVYVIHSPRLVEGS
jgi:hypothetical protein